LCGGGQEEGQGQRMPCRMEGPSHAGDLGRESGRREVDWMFNVTRGSGDFKRETEK
jgi:hypothetical protein